MTVEELLKINEAGAFGASLRDISYAAPDASRKRNPVCLFAIADGHIVGNGFASIYFQGYDYSQLNALIEFLEESGCCELATRYRKGRDIFYRGRTDLLDFDDCRSAGVTGDHLSEVEWDEIHDLEEGMIGPEGLIAKADEPIMRYIKNHPEILSGLIEKIPTVFESVT